LAKSEKQRYFYEFGPFRIDRDRRQLLRQDQPVTLQRKTFDILFVLVENSGKVVSKDDLLKAVWPDAFVEESNLTQHIFVLRKTLADGVEEKKYIVTVPGKGYRFDEKVNVIAVGDVVLRADREVVEPRPELVQRETPKVTGDEESLIVARHTRSRMLVEEQQAPLKALPGSSWPWMRYATGALCLLLIGAASVYLLRHPKQRLSGQDTVVLADFGNRTGDPVFDDTLKTALDIAVAQSPFLNPLSGNKVRNTLRLMARPADTKVTPDIAREVCQRAGGKAYIDGSIVQLGAQYVLTLEALSCQSGDTMALEQATAPSKEKVLDALSGAATQLRSALGESLTTVRKFDAALPQITTPSLDALKAFAVGRKALYQMDPGSALPYFQRALELDPNFAMAYVEMGNAYFGMYQMGRARESFAKAFTLRDHTSHLEELQIDSEYYGYTTGDLDKALQAMQEDVEYKHNSVYLGLADVYARLGQYGDAAESARRLVTRDPDYSLAFIDLVSDDLALHDFGGVRQTIQQAQSRGIDSYPVRKLLYTFAFVQGDPAGIAEQQNWFACHPDFEHYGLALSADSEAYAGHLNRARALTGQAAGSAARAHDNEDAAMYRANRALQEAEYGNSAEARQSAAEALKLTAGNPAVAVQAALAFAATGETAQATSLAQELNQRFPLDTQIQLLAVPAIQAQLQLARHQPELALAALQPGLRIEYGATRFSTNTTSCLYPTFVRGQAYLAAGRGAQAAAEFRKIIDHSGIVGNCWTGVLARLGVARANTLESKAGGEDGRVRAKAAYKDFLVLWKDADPDVPILRDAKAEYGRLQ
jgi:eukaryotic-like serine/threonine-protein kinase